MGKRVECNQCKNFIQPEWKDDGDMFPQIIKNAKCKIGKRVMFRMPKDNFDSGGYYRYCDDFKN